MANHFRALGLRVDSEQDLEELCAIILDAGIRFETELGDYVIWPEETGPHLWLHVQEGQVVSLQPHFGGESERRAGLIQRIQAAGDSALEGGFYAWADPTDAPADGDYPFVFYVPDFQRHSQLLLPLITNIQLTTFADSLTAYPSEADFHRSQGSRNLQYATESFLPLGTFDEPARPTAHFVGRIQETVSERNPVTGLPYARLEVSTLGGPLTVVCDPQTLDGQPTRGGVVEVTGWLSGRLL